MSAHKLLLTVAPLWLLSAAALPAQQQELVAGSPPPRAATEGEEGARPARERCEWRYRLRPSDILAVHFPVTDLFNQVVAVQPDGFVTLRAVGDVHVAGLTLPEVTERIRAAYSRIVSPQLVAVELREFEKPYYVVSGEVGLPGKFELRGETTVAEAIGIAGGFRDTAKHSQVLLFRRVAGGWLQAKSLDLKKMLRGANLSEDVHLRHGDMIHVPKNVYSKLLPFVPRPSMGVALTPIR